MEKVKNLQDKAGALRRLLEKYSPSDSDADSLLKWLTPLFTAIDNGEVTPPHKYEFSMALGKEPMFYERHRDVRSVEADFVCALEDWESQDWYRQLRDKGHEGRA